MNIALTGAAGIGKTTLARALAQATGTVLLEEDFAEVVRAFNTRSPVAAENQRSACGAWLDRREAAYAQHAHWVEDRCGLDVLYRWLTAGLSDADNGKTQALIARVQQSLLRLDALVVLPLKVTQETRNHEGLRRAGSVSRLWRSHALALGLALQLMPPERVLQVPQQCDTPESRRDWVLAQVTAAVR